MGPLKNNNNNSSYINSEKKDHLKEALGLGVGGQLLF